MAAKTRATLLTALGAFLILAAGLLAGFGGLLGVPYTNLVRATAVGLCAGSAIYTGVATLIKLIAAHTPKGAVKL